MIRFKYPIPESLLPSMQNVFHTFDSEIVGYLPEELANDLKHCALYLICHLDYSKRSNTNVYSNPVGIVARNDGDAIDSYYAMTKDGNGTCYAILVDRCDTLRVIAY